MGSWGRHGWPKKDEGLRIYKERKGAYFLLEPDARGPRGYDAIANALEGNSPSLASCSISPEWLLKAGVKRVQWSEVPKEWQSAFRPWLTKKPEAYRGFWLVGQQPQPKAKRTKATAKK